MKTQFSGKGVFQLDDLRRSQLLDSSSEAAFDDLTRLAAYICKTPVALISLISGKRQWIKSQVGLTTTRTKAYLAFCTYAILQPEICQSDWLIIPDTSADKRFANNALVKSTPQIRFYAGVPLVTPEGRMVGVLSVIDYVPRDLNEEQQQALLGLSRQAITQLELHKSFIHLKQVITQYKQTEDTQQNIQGHTTSTPAEAQLIPSCIQTDNLSLTAEQGTALAKQRPNDEQFHSSELSPRTQLGMTNPQEADTVSQLSFFGRTSEQITAEIEQKFGFFPPFFEPAQQNPQVLENLWQQTLNGYVNNPLPSLFKEKLSAYLSRFCPVPYCMISHSCSLRSLGMKPQKVLALLESPPPKEAAINKHLKVLVAAPNGLTVFPSNSLLEESLLYCAIFIALEHEQAQPCRTQLSRLLGTANYQHLITFIAYVKMCHVWIEAHPEISYEADKRVQSHLKALVEEEPGLADFFQHYAQRIRIEQQISAERRAESAERQRNLKALQKAAAENLRLAQAVASASDGVVITDANQANNPIIYLNPAFTRITGYQAEEVLGRNCRFLQGADTSHEALAQIKRAIAERREVQVTLLNYRKDGQPFWNELKISPVFSGTGNLLYFVGVQTDITEQKRAEEERIQLLAREQTARAAAVREANRSRNIIESITDGFFALDNEWRFTYLNSRAEQILFRTKKELIGQCIWHELSEVVDSTFEVEYRRAVAQQVTTHFEAFYSPLGTWFEVRAYPYQDGLSVYFRDVTERKQSEAALLERSRLSTLEAEVGTALGQGGTLPESLKRCTEAMLKHLDAVFAAILTFNPETSQLELQASTGQHPELELDGDDPLFQHTMPLDGSLIGFVAHTRQPYLTQDSGRGDSWGRPPKGGFETRLYESQLAESCSLIVDSYFAGYPLIVEDYLVGVMALDTRQPFTQGMHEALGWVANGIAVAIDRTWAREALMTRREGLLFRLASQIRDSLDLDTILGTAVNEIRSLLQVDRCQYLWCWSSGNQPGVTVTHEANADPDQLSLMGECPPQHLAQLGEKICLQEAMRVDDVPGDKNLDTATKALLTSLDITSCLLLPLETHAGHLGAIICSNYQGSRPWSNSEFELLQAVVDQLAIAIDQAELYAQSRAAALAAQMQAQQLEIALHDLKQTESRLIQTEKMSSLGQMVAGIAHEINNPVNFIMGNLMHTGDYIQDLLKLINLYQEHYPHPEPKIQAHTENIDFQFIVDDLPKMLSSMEMGAERIRQIVLSLRNFSRLDEAEMKPVDIHEGLENSLLILHNRLKPVTNLTGIQVIKEYGELPKVECYAGQLNQVFMNILCNAIDALDGSTEQDKNQLRNSNSPASIPTIRIRTEVLDDNQVTIRIADNGPGMTDDVRKCLFDPFFTTKPVGKGTGLGLSISYQIVVEKHGGVLKCVSELGQGAEFWIQIPLLQDGD